MYSAHNGQKRGLLRPHGVNGAGPMFRSLPLFGFLAGLLIFFFVFYVYQTQSTELNMMRDQIELGENRLVKLKAKNIDLEAELENYRKIEDESKKELQALRTNKKKCDAQLKMKKDKEKADIKDLEQVQKDKNMCLSNLASLNSKMAEANITINALYAELSAIKSQLETEKNTSKGLEAKLQTRIAQDNTEQLKEKTKIPAQSAESLVNYQNASALYAEKNGLQSVEKANINDESNVIGNGIKVEQNNNARAEDVKEQQTAVEPTLAAGMEHSEVKESQVDMKRPITELSQNEIHNNEANVLAPPPQLVKINSVEGGNDVKFDPPVLAEPRPELNEILRIRGKVADKEKNEPMKERINNDGDGSKVVGGEYNDNMEAVNEAARGSNNVGGHLKIPRFEQ